MERGEDVLFLNRSIPPFTTLTPTIESNLASIGIKTRLRELDTSSAYSTLQTVKNLIPISAIAGWAKDFADPSTFGVQFISEGINCEGQVNYSEIGMTREKALECGVGPEWQAAGGTALPSVDDRFAQCTRLTGRDRTTCWIGFDQNLMENVVPWVPYLWNNASIITAPSVTHYEFDQFAVIPSLCHIAVNNNATVR